MRSAGHVAGIGGMRNAYKILVGKHEETTLKTGRRLEDIIRIDPREIWREGVNWIHLTQTGR
jgi:hypothetical protein